MEHTLEGMETFQFPFTQYAQPDN